MRRPAGLVKPVPPADAVAKLHQHKNFRKTLSISKRESWIGAFATISRARGNRNMTMMKAALLSLFMLGAIGLGAVGIYSADAGGTARAIDGYGVSLPQR
jgi:hypothetical protein